MIVKVELKNYRDFHMGVEGGGVEFGRGDVNFVHFTTCSFICKHKNVNMMCKLVEQASYRCFEGK